MTAARVGTPPPHQDVRPPRARHEPALAEASRESARRRGDGAPAAQRALAAKRHPRAQCPVEKARAPSRIAPLLADALASYPTVWVSRRRLPSPRPETGMPPKRPDREAEAVAAEDAASAKLSRALFDEAVDARLVSRVRPSSLKELVPSKALKRSDCNMHCSSIIG